MKLQFNLFGFNVQVSRAIRYAVAIDYEGMDQFEDTSVWDSKSAFFTFAVLRGWQRARALAGLYKTPVTYIIFEIDSDLHRIKQMRSGTIQIKKSVAFFSV